MTLRGLPGPWAPALFLAALAAFGCRGDEPSSSAAGGLTIGQITSAVTLDPHAHDQLQTLTTLSHFYNTLVSFDREMQIQPELAVRWESPTETLWRFHLRRGVSFHDGQPFGAEDVVASLRRALRPGSDMAHYVQAIAEIRAVDHSTVEVVTEHPAPVLLNKLAFVAIVPRTTGEEPVTRPVGTGPYRFVSGEPGGAIVGRRFEGHWGPRPVFDTVTFLPLQRAAQRAEAVAEGRADIVAQFPSDRWSWAQKQPQVRMVSRQGLGAVLLAFSLRRGSPFADPRVRRAVALGLDRRRIVAEALSGLGGALEQVVPPAVVGYSAGLPAWPQDRDEAARLLREAGWKKDAEVPFLVSESQQEVAGAVALQLAEMGIRVKLTSLPQKEFYERWRRETAPLSVLGWSAETGDASATLEPLFHAPRGGYGGFNHTGYSNAEMDRLIELADRTLRPADRRGRLASIMQLLRDELPVVPLVLRYDLYAVRSDLEWEPRLDRFVRASEIHPAGRP